MKIRLFKVTRKRTEPVRLARVMIHDTDRKVIAANTFIEYRVLLINDQDDAMVVKMIEDSRVRGQNVEQDAMDFAVRLGLHLGIPETIKMERVEERRRNHIVLVDVATGSEIHV